MIRSSCWKKAMVSHKALEKSVGHECAFTLNSNSRFNKGDLTSKLLLPPVSESFSFDAEENQDPNHEDDDDDSDDESVGAAAAKIPVSPLLWIPAMEHHKTNQDNDTITPN